MPHKHSTIIARKLRSDATDAETLLWRHLRGRRLLGAKFRRQTPIGPHIADFACEQARLVIELDGGQHADSTTDALRTPPSKPRATQSSASGITTSSRTPTASSKKSPEPCA